MLTRKATKDDIEQLIKMRHDFTLEHNTQLKITAQGYREYHEEMESFLVGALGSDRWIV